MGLNEYNKKRKFSKTPEPAGLSQPARQVRNRKRNIQREARAFVIQKHRATRLHYDFRLEDENGALKSWAVPKGPSLDPQIKRLAVLTEDHPYDYLLFEGTIPEGNYGAGTVIVWDHGTYSISKPLLDQFREGKISFELHGRKLHGRFSLVKTKKENQWLLIKTRDEFATSNDLTSTSPYSVLSNRTNDDLGSKPSRKGVTSKRLLSNGQFSGIPPLKTKKRGQNKSMNNNAKSTSTQQLSSKVRPMLAYPVDKAFDSKYWAFEVKWDGVRAISYVKKGTVLIQSRNGNNITQKYPEISNVLERLSTNIRSAVFDGEIVVLDEKGLPDFQGHQRRMHVNDEQEIETLSKEIPTIYYLFDILYLDGNDLRTQPYLSRREILAQVMDAGPGDLLKISDYVEEHGREMLKHTINFNLEGIVAKRKSSHYHEGVRSKEWLKIKNIRTQDCVVVGYTEGEGNRRNAFGSLLLAVYDTEDKSYQFVGHVGSGFDHQAVRDIYSMLRDIRAESMPIKTLPYKNRRTTWVKPVLVAEVKFTQWTLEGIMRAPIFLRFRSDKSPQECVLEADQPVPTETILKSAATNDESQTENSISEDNQTNTTTATDSIKTNTTARTKLEFSNLDKVYWPAINGQKPITKGDLISYYESISELILPHLRDRPLSLSRYPNGIYGKSFYHKDWDQSKPSYVKTAKVYSEHRNAAINYLVCNNFQSLLWIANLGAIEMHPWYSRIKDFEHCKTSRLLYEEKCGLNFPDFVVLDLDPYIYSGKERAGGEPEYNLRGFRAAAEVAFDLKDVLDQLDTASYVKSSGKTGLHIYIPTIPKFSYDQTRSFAETMGKILMSKIPNKITMEWSTAKRKGKVFFDYNQNSRGKTIASVWSVRPTPLATVSVPIEWDQLDNFNFRDFTLITVPNIFKSRRDPWRSVLEEKQDLSKIMTAMKDLA
jgi:bifunctional non-homologous end joining protein LigD